MAAKPSESMTRPETLDSHKGKRHQFKGLYKRLNKGIINPVSINAILCGLRQEDVGILFQQSLDLLAASKKQEGTATILKFLCCFRQAGAHEKLLDLLQAEADESVLFHVFDFVLRSISTLPFGLALARLAWERAVSWTEDKEHVERRLAGVRLLCEFKPAIATTEVFLPLIHRESSFDVARVILEHFAGQYDSRIPDAIAHVLRRKDTQLQCLVLGLLHKYRSLDSVRRIGIVLSEDNPAEVKLAAVDALEYIGSAEAVDFLLASLYDLAPEVRLRSAMALGSLGEPIAFAPLVAAISNEELDARTKLKVVGSLASLGDGRAARYVIDYLARNPLGLADEICVFLKGNWSRAAAATVMSRLRAGDDEEKARALSLLARGGDKNARELASRFAKGRRIMGDVLLQSILMATGCREALPQALRELEALPPGEAPAAVPFLEGLIHDELIFLRRNFGPRLDQEFLNAVALCLRILQELSGDELRIFLMYARLFALLGGAGQDMVKPLAALFLNIYASLNPPGDFGFMYAIALLDDLDERESRLFFSVLTGLFRNVVEFPDDEISGESPQDLLAEIRLDSFLNSLYQERLKSTNPGGKGFLLESVIEGAGLAYSGPVEHVDPGIVHCLLEFFGVRSVARQDVQALLDKERAALALRGTGERTDSKGESTEFELSAGPTEEEVEEEGSLPRYANPRPRQAFFRAAVLELYGEFCAVCGLRIPELLEAAHIVTKQHKGIDEPGNGLPLCCLHHKAFDSGFFGIEPATTTLHYCRGGPDQAGLKIRYKDLKHLMDKPDVEALGWRWERWLIIQGRDGTR